MATNSRQESPTSHAEQHMFVETQLLGDIATTLSQTDKRRIHKQCKELLAKISDKDQVLSLDEVLQIIQDWQPKKEILCLYVRIARKLPANFHLDSISTLMCVAKQCGYTPVNFLTKTKCLQVTPSGGKFGVSFMFKTISNKKINGHTLDRKFVGLSLTLTLLESTVANSCGVISRDGMRSRTPREPVSKSLDLGGPSSFSFETMPSNEFHKRTSLINRLWLAINHRWMSFHLVQQLFVNADNLCENKDIIVYSFMMHASCGKSRFQFLDPMAGYCFRFSTRDDIEANRTRLNDLWKSPSDFLTFGNYCLQRDSTERKILSLIDTFTDVKSQFTRTSSYGRSIDNNRRWLMLRAYIFSFWLKRESNNQIRTEVELALASRSTSTIPKKNHDTRSTKACTTDCINAETNDYQITTIGRTECVVKRRRLNHHIVDEPRLWFCSQESSSTSCTNSTTQTSKVACNKSDETLPSNLGTSTRLCPSLIRNSLLTKDWSSIQLMSQVELDQVCASYLLVHTDGGLDIISNLSPFEVYSADRLKDFMHSRVCGPPGYHPRHRLGEVILHIGSGSDQHLDRYSKLLHVVRKGSTYFKEFSRILPSTVMFANLCKAILKYGSIDNVRSTSQYRVNIGCGGQHFPKGVPATLIGKAFAAKLDTDHDFETHEVMSTIGAIVEFLWRVVADIQRDVGDVPLAPDSLRWNAYAKHLCDYLKIGYPVGFEDVTLVVSPISSEELDVVAEHRDVMNDNVAGYSRTCVFNTCFSIEANTYMHMQVIGNFRRSIRQYMVPFAKSLQSTIANGKQYIASWQSNMQFIFGGISPNRNWDPFDRSHFFLCDDLPFRTLTICDGSTNHLPRSGPIEGCYLLTEIGLSRVTSLSMFIDPICQLKDQLSTDQLIELSFFASMLSNPFWFHHAMGNLIERCHQSNGEFSLSVHPMYDLIKELYFTFGTWQGGPHNRWSPCGGVVPITELFGAHPSATKQQKHNGKEKLEAILDKLFDHLTWVNSLVGKGLEPSVDLPLSCIQLQWESVRKAIHDIVPCQFSLFRLSVFTTIVIGCNLLSPGPHLKQIIIPFPGTASFKHLLAPSKGQISKQSATDLATNNKEAVVEANEDDRVSVQDHDRLMMYLCYSVGRRKYVRDEMECLLCESHPGRSLECRDWFCKGQNIYDCNDDGIVLIRHYGKEHSWTELGPPLPWSFKFLRNQQTHGFSSNTQSIIYDVNTSIANYARSFGIELRHNQESIIFNGRKKTKTSKQQSEHYDNPYLRSFSGARNLGLHHYRSAIMFSKSNCDIKTHSKMVVLGNGEKPKSLQTECNMMESFTSGMALCEEVRQTVVLSGDGSEQYKYMAAGCYHQEVDDFNKGITYFPGHLDKCYIQNVWFIPLGEKHFFTLLAVPTSWNIPQDKDSIKDYQFWLNGMETDEENP